MLYSLTVFIEIAQNKRFIVRSTAKGSELYLLSCDIEETVFICNVVAGTYYLMASDPNLSQLSVYGSPICHQGGWETPLRTLLKLATRSYVKYMVYFYLCGWSFAVTNNSRRKLAPV